MVDATKETDRNELIDTLGNLTLLTSRLNSKVSNGPWVGVDGKREGLKGHSVLILSRKIIYRQTTEGTDEARSEWTDEAIRERTEKLTNVILQLWPVPLDHQPAISREPKLRKKVRLSDLIAGGALHAGMPLFPRRHQYIHRIATLLPDGRIDVDGVAYAAPSQAAAAITGKPTSGWWFFLTEQTSKRSLRNVRRAFVEATAVDVEEDESDEDEEDDEE